VNGEGSIMPGAKVDPEMDVAAPETDVGFLPFGFGTEMEIDGDAGKLVLGSTSFALPFALAVAAAFSARSFFALSVFMLLR
jgi:hypothetical protein